MVALLHSSVNLFTDVVFRLGFFEEFMDGLAGRGAGEREKLTRQKVAGKRSHEIQELALPLGIALPLGGIETFRGVVHGGFSSIGNLYFWFSSRSHTEFEAERVLALRLALRS